MNGANHLQNQNGTYSWPVFLNQEIRFFKTDKASGDSYCAGICSYKVPRIEVRDEKKEIRKWLKAI